MAGRTGVDDLDTLALFIGVIELGSLSQAGARHGISQPAASMRIAGLEKRMRLRLLDRTTTGCRPTANGLAVAQWARELIAHADRMNHAVATLRDDDGITVAASLTIAEHLLPRWLAALHVERPGTRVSVTIANSASVIESVRCGDATLGFIETPAATTGLRRRIVARDELVVAVAADHPWGRRRTPVRPHQLAATPMVLREPGSGTRATLDAALATFGLETARPVLELASTAAVRNAVAAGVAPTIISELAIADDVAAGRLVVVTTAEIELSRPLVAIWKGSTTPPILRWIGEASTDRTTRHV